MRILVLYCVCISTSMYGMYSHHYKLAEDEVEVDVDCGTYCVKAIAKKPKSDGYCSRLAIVDNIFSRFLRAVRANNQETVSALLDESHLIINCMENGESALHIAALQGNLEMVNMLLDRGADFNRTSKENDSYCPHEGKCPILFNMTPLHIAALHGFDKVAKALLKKNPELEVYNNCRETALHLAIKNRHVSTACLLLSHGANAKTFANDKTLLHLAAENNHAELIDILMRKEIDVNARDRNQRTALHSAAMHNYIHVAQKLLAYHPNIDAYDAAHKTPLCLAVAEGHGDMTRILLLQRANVSLTDADGNTPLHLAVKRKDVPMVQLLLEHNAGVDSVNGAGNTPLHIATRSRDIKLVSLLLSNGANTTLRDNYGHNALFYAIDTNYALDTNPDKISSIIELLAKYHANINDCGNQSSLYLSAAHNSVKAAVTLISLGAHIRSNLQDESSCFRAAANRGYNDIIKLLLNNFHDKEFANEYLEGLKEAANNNHSGTMRLFLDHAGYRDAQNWREQLSRSLLDAFNEEHYDVVRAYLAYDIPLHKKCLHAAIRSKQTDIVRTLVLQKHVDLGERSEDGLLPEQMPASGEIQNFLTVTIQTTQRLIQAIYQNDYAEFTRCLEAGVGLSYRDRAGNTPLHHAAMNSRSRMIKDLLIHGSNPAIMNNEARTAVHFAADKPHCLGIFMHAATSQDIIESQTAARRTDDVFNHLVQLDKHVAQKRKIEEQIRKQSKYIGTGMSILAGIGLGTKWLKNILQAYRTFGPLSTRKTAALLTGLTAATCGLVYKYVPQIVNELRIEKPVPFYMRQVNSFGEFVAFMARNFTHICKRLCRSRTLYNVRDQIIEDNQTIDAETTAFSYDVKTQITKGFLQGGFMRGKFDELIQQHPLQTQEAQNMFRQTSERFN